MARAPQDEGQRYSRQSPFAIQSAIIPGGRIRRIKEHPMTLSIGHLQPIVALAAGILILIMPRLLNYIVAIYLIIVGIIGLGIIK